MLRTLNRWQHKLFSACFHIPEGTEPLKNRPWQNHSSIPNHRIPKAHTREHQPRILKAWQTSIGNFVKRHTAQQ